MVLFNCHTALAAPQSEESKTAQAEKIIAASEVAKKIRDSLDPEGSELSFYVEGLTARLGSEYNRDGSPHFLIPALILNNGIAIDNSGIILKGMDVLPSIRVLLDLDGKPILVFVQEGADITDDFIAAISEAKALSLKLTDMPVVDLSHFSSLKNLKVSADWIEELNLPENSQLRYASILISQIGKINHLDKQQVLNSLEMSAKGDTGYEQLTGHKVLERLILTMSSSQLDVSSLEKLMDLKLYNPKYEDIKNIHHLKFLKFLKFSFIQDKDIATIKLPASLKYILFLNPQKETLPSIADLPHLETLRLWGINDSHLPVIQNVPKLEKLVIERSDITSLNGIEHIPSLKHLTAYNNQISDISALSPLEQLTEINLTRNQITAIGNIGKKPNLKLVNLSFNPLSSIDFNAIKQYPYCAFGTDATPFEENASQEEEAKLMNLWKKGHL